jgi:hypothetical protein
MSKIDEYLKIYSDMQPHCEVCVAKQIVSSQTAAQNRGLRVRGYLFKKVGNNYGWSDYCSCCDKKTVHRQLLSIEPEASKERVAIPKNVRDKILKLFDNTDARFGRQTAEALEVDHRKPRIRETSDELSCASFSDEQLKNTFMLLTRQNNLTKSRACESCVQTNKRGWDQIKWWYHGSEDYEGSCEGCFWYNPEKWKEEITNELYRIKT